MSNAQSIWRVLVSGLEQVTENDTGLGRKGGEEQYRAQKQMTNHFNPP